MQTFETLPYIIILVVFILLIAASKYLTHNNLTNTPNFKELLSKIHQKLKPPKKTKLDEICIKECIDTINFYLQDANNAQKLVIAHSIAKHYDSLIPGELSQKESEVDFIKLTQSQINKSWNLN